MVSRPSFHPPVCFSDHRPSLTLGCFKSPLPWQPHMWFSLNSLSKYVKLTITQTQHHVPSSSVVAVGLLATYIPIPGNGDYLLKTTLRVPLGSQDDMQPANNGHTSSFEQLCSDVTNTKCLATSHLCHILSGLVMGGWEFVNGIVSIQYLDSGNRLPIESLSPFMSDTILTRYTLDLWVALTREGSGNSLGLGD